MKNSRQQTESNRHDSEDHEGAVPEEKDWHRYEIVCAVRMAGGSMASLSRAHGLAEGTLANALNRPWPKGELIIASAIGVEAEQIWPSRYSARRERDHFKQHKRRRP